ncbi:MAG: prolyl oligopeptidase family serine peptidase [Bryobacteraceae bacterium]|nr:prolyl oligopeptidase family serine peptidase [Bryobacteraceae bacterium]MDW8377219.1 prolyl oligopeptidase family serine peptidase [Bryobacterales bacterium]
MSCLLVSVLLGPVLWSQAPAPHPLPYTPTPEQLVALRAKLGVLGDKIRALERSSPSALLADVRVYHKAVEWILRHPEEFYAENYYEDALKLLDVGLQRASELGEGKPSWPGRRGRVARAYRSRVDDSVQPYVMILPESYDAKTPMRLDVVLHGRNARLNEVLFLAEAEWGKPAAVAGDRLELHVFGRTNNAYRWAGETDVFEALAAAQTNYAVDSRRIVLRGFSMGGAGAWHLGLHHPDQWAAIEAGAGFTDTQGHARIAQAPQHEILAWRIYDAYLYARNAVMVPAVGYGSVDDPQLRAAKLIAEQLGRERLEPSDLRPLFLTGPAVGHRFAPESKKLSEAFLAQALLQRTQPPDRVRFVTYTTRYNRCFWVHLEELEKHYERAEIDARRQGRRVLIEAHGVRRIRLEEPSDVEIEGQVLTQVRELEKLSGGWVAARPTKGFRKRHGLQGPIDDAFGESFLCVRPTGRPGDEVVHRAALERLERFRQEYDKYLRADIRLKNDRELTPEDIANHHLVLFGDPTSNRLISRVLPQTPLRWDTRRVRVGHREWKGEHLLLVAIYPNPLNPKKYVVINSGHTFGAKDFQGTNALLYPRLGDWAVLESTGELRAAGFFDESWR